MIKWYNTCSLIDGKDASVYLIDWIPIRLLLVLVSILSMQVKWACFIFFWIFGVENLRSREAEKLGKSGSREAEKQRS